MTQMEELSDRATRHILLGCATPMKNCTVHRFNEIVDQSTSQLGQDLLALSLRGRDNPGFFVEFGASNGRDLSNSYLLEKEFGWNGILCEPGKNWHKQLEMNRRTSIDKRCVYSHSGQSVIFSETSMGELSTIREYLRKDGHRRIRKVASSYTVSTVSLVELLRSYNAPEYIDFLSIDTEGSEFVILENFDFNAYSFGLICVEHNYSTNRSKIGTLLSSHGYIQVFREYSKFDDWWVSESNLKKLRSGSDQ